MVEEKQQLNLNERLYRAIVAGSFNEVTEILLEIKSVGASLNDIKYLQPLKPFIFDFFPAQFRGNITTHFSGIYYRVSKLSLKSVTPLLLAIYHQRQYILPQLLKFGATFKHLDARLQCLIKWVAVHDELCEKSLDKSILLTDLDRLFSEKLHGIYFNSDRFIGNQRRALNRREHNLVLQKAIMLSASALTENQQLSSSDAYCLKMLIKMLQENNSFRIYPAQIVTYIDAFIETYHYQVGEGLQLWFRKFSEDINELFYDLFPSVLALEEGEEMNSDTELEIEVITSSSPSPFPGNIYGVLKKREQSDSSGNGLNTPVSGGSALGIRRVKFSFADSRPLSPVSPNSPEVSSSPIKSDSGSVLSDFESDSKPRGTARAVFKPITPLDL